MFDTGEIVYLTYYERRPAPSDLVMREASKMLSAYLQNYAMIQHTGGEQPDPASALEGFRQKARQMMEQHGVAISVPFQIGQKESQDNVRRIQSGPNFLRWEDPNLIGAILEF